MPKQIIGENMVDLDRESLVEVSKPLFYGYIFMAGMSLLIGSPQYAGTLLGISGLAALTFVSAALAQGVKDGWKSFLDLISIASLLMVVSFGCYVAASLSMGI